MVDLRTSVGVKKFNKELAQYGLRYCVRCNSIKCLRYDFPKENGHHKGRRALCSECYNEQRREQSAMTKAKLISERKRKMMQEREKELEEIFSKAPMAKTATQRMKDKRERVKNVKGKRK